MSIIEDIQRRSAHIHWPEGIVPEQADLFAHNDIVIAAPAEKVWEHLIQATTWPDWYSNASDVTVNAPRMVGRSPLAALGDQRPGKQTARSMGARERTGTSGCQVSGAPGTFRWSG